MGKLEKGLLFVALIGLLAALWPYAASLYDLSGEIALPGQAAGVVHWLNTAVRPQPRLAPDAVNAMADVSPYGVNTFLEQEVEPEKRARSLALIRDAGFDFIRQEFPWEDIEIHGKGDFEDRRNVDAIGVVDAWAKYDNIVALAQQHDLQIIARLGNPPAWSRSRPVAETGSLAPPDDYADFGDFAAAVATRYQGQIRYYQIWNEPNGNEEWGLHQDVNAEAYTDLLCTGYRRIKAVDPDAVILAGALTPTLEASGRNLNDLIYLQRMYNTGAVDCFDVMSAQGYGLWSGALDQRLRPTVINYPHHMLIRDLMVRNGDAATPIWISEMGWNVAPEGLPATYGRVSLQEQAQFAMEAYQRARAEWPWLGVVNYWFFKRPSDREQDQPWYYFRLMEPDFTPLPVYEALAEYLPAAPEPIPRPDWVNTWDRLRSLLFLVSSAILFFGLLRWLAPEMRGE